MANELKLEIKTSLVHATKSIAQTNVNLFSPTSKKTFQDQVSVTTTEAVIATGGLTTPRVMHLYNNDATNFVKVGKESGGAMQDNIRVWPASAVVIGLVAGATYRWQADTATCAVDITIYDT